MSLYFFGICRYGEVVDVNLIRDKGTGKSKGFAFLAYEDQRSTILAVGSFFFKKIKKLKSLINSLSCCTLVLIVLTF